MARKCLNCDNLIPNWTIIDGQRKNVSKRKYCFDCSPFGSHNTARIHKKVVDVVRRCLLCNKEFINCRKNKCASCEYHIRLDRRLDKVLDIVGTKCWLCGYDKGKMAKPVLEFHHVKPKDKSFNISTREMAMFKWDRILCELKKCVLLCCRCHREYHASIISEEVVEEIHRKYWRVV